MPTENLIANVGEELTWLQTLFVICETQLQQNANAPLQTKEFTPANHAGIAVNSTDAFKLMCSNMANMCSNAVAGH